MDKKFIEDVATLIVDQLAYGFITLCLIAILFYALQGFAKEIISYLVTKFSDIGYGAVIEEDGERYRVQKIRFSYVQLLNLDRPGVILRIPIGVWKGATLKLTSNGKKKD